jgi:hypothetical protein
MESRNVPNAADKRLDSVHSNFLRTYYDGYDQNAFGVCNDLFLTNFKIQL